MCNLADLIEEKGIEMGIEKGIIKGIEKGKYLTLTELVKNGDLSMAVAAKTAGMTVQEFEELMDEE